jgi:mono/diheme cytochrome c family protein
MLLSSGRFRQHASRAGSHFGRPVLKCLLACGILGAWLTIAPLRLAAQDPGSIPKADAPPHGNPQNGKRLYDKYGCYECHGGQGQGSQLSGPRIGPSSGSFSGFLTYIRRPTGQMPPYTRKITTDAELADMYAFLQSVPQPPDVEKIPLLKALVATGKGR